MTQLVLNERRRKENVLDDRIRVVGEFIFRIQEVVGNQGFQRMDLQFGKCPSNDGISDPLSYKFEIGRGRGANEQMIASLRQATVVEASLKIEVTSRIYRLPSSLPPFVYVSRPRSSASISTSFLVATLAAIMLLA